MKKRLLYLFMFVAIVFGLTACNNKAGELNIAGRTLLEVGEKVELNTIGQTEDGKFKWKSSKAKVLTVEPQKDDEDNVVPGVGVVEAVAVGEAKVTVTHKGQKAVHTIKVVDKITDDQLVKTIALEPKLEVTPVSYGFLGKVIVGEKFHLNATVLPLTADQKVIWSSSDDKIASVNQNGEVTTHLDGEVRIYAKTAGLGYVLDDDGEVVVDDKGNKVKATKTASFDLTIVHPIEVDGDLETFVNEEVALEATVFDNVNLTKKLTWTSTNPNIATVDQNGNVTPKAVGKTVIKVTAEGRDKKADQTYSYPITVNKRYAADEVAGGEEGIEVSFKYADPEVKAEILAAMERFLINKGASIPIINNSTATLYSSRVKLPTDDYVALMGYGAMYGELENNDADHPYRNYTSANPVTLNHLTYKDSIESDILTLVQLSLFSIEFNEDFTGYEMVASAAKDLAKPVRFNEETNEWEEITEVEEDGKLRPFDLTKDMADAWLIELSDQLYWVNSKGEKKEQITADDFLYTYRMALDPAQTNNRANYFYSSAGLPIKNAKKYFEQKDADGEVIKVGKAEGDYEVVPWEEVGLHKVDDFAFVIEIEAEYQQWDIHYNMSGFLWAPVYKPLFEKGFNEDRTITSYGNNNIDNLMYSGAYYLSYFENQKEIRYRKNPYYFKNEKVHAYTPEAITTRIVKDANAAIELYERGELDVIGIPATHYEQYKNNPGLKKSPGAVSFRYSVNRLTQAESDLTYGVGAWKTKPILQEDDFMWALYFGMNRKHIAEEITKVSTAEQFYFTNAYVVDPLAGLAYRDTEAGKAVAEGIFDGDVNLSTATIGYNAALARDFYVKALDSMVQKGVITEGTKKKPEIVEIEIASFDSVTHVAILQYLKDSFEANFNAQEKYPHIQFRVKTAPQPGMDVYYEKQMKGRYDLALAGISGGTLDPIGFLEVFCDDNRGGLLLSLGLDTHNPSILIDLDLDGDGKKDGPKLWSFDALYEATAGTVFVKMGVEAVKPEPEA